MQPELSPRQSIPLIYPWAAALLALTVRICCNTEQRKSEWGQRQSLHYMKKSGNVACKTLIIMDSMASIYVFALWALPRFPANSSVPVRPIKK